MATCKIKPANLTNGGGGGGGGDSGDTLIRVQATTWEVLPGDVIGGGNEDIV